MSVLARWKDATRHAHESLERRLDLLRGDFTPAQYRRLLMAMYGFYAPWEAHAIPALEAHAPGFFAPRAKRPKLEADLATLGMNPSEIASLPHYPFVPKPAGLPALLGSAYVLEGATLGGKILSAHFRRHLGLEEGALHFFSGYGAENGRYWQEFRALVDKNCPESHAVEGAEMAGETFRTLGNWLTAQGAARQD